MENNTQEINKNPMNPDVKSNIAIVLSVIAIGISLYGGGIMASKTPEGPEGFLKMTAKEVGVSGRTYDKCIADPAIKALVDEDINETSAIVAAAELQGIGTPFNLVVTDTQVIPVSGAYPYEFFDLIIKEITDTGSVSAETLAQFDVTEFDANVRDQFRPFNAADDHYRGAENASIQIIEYSDLECPFCSRIHPTLEQVVANNDNVVWAYRHLPLDSIHPQAMPAAIASECVAREEGNEAFGTFIDTIFENQDKLSK
tara:strand:- start:114 stop:884 length:771 start_codon:yes stop_codon:yes gene_type:complete